MSFRTIGTEQSSKAHHINGRINAAVLSVKQTEVEEELPIVKAEADGFFVLIEFLPVVAAGAVGEAQMVMSEGVTGIVLENLAMTADGVGVVFHAEIVIGEGVADVLIEVGFLPGTGERRPLAYHYNTDSQKQSQPAVSQQRLNSAVHALGTRGPK